MSAKCLDQQGRWRNKVVAFRMSPEEDELLETAVRLSGLTKLDELKRLKKGEDVPEDLLEVIRLITITMAGMKAE